MDIAHESSRYGSLTAQLMRRRVLNGVNGGASISGEMYERKSENKVPYFLTSPHRNSNSAHFALHILNLKVPTLCPIKG
jgi:hypothetical protein